ncbi:MULTISPECIES: DUF4867 family protein [unclassified Fictibacillus]|uniref:DUF4867 family protein n=1 Tax=Fictibacillus TaxID=1329200 RepID=UPI001E561C44|nr:MULTISPECIES: DUF4867 family protein [unclassified Fictibacillus]
MSHVNMKENSMIIEHVSDDSFKSYGKVITGYDFTRLMNTMKQSTKIPEHENVYVASEPILEDDLVKKQIETYFYGEMPAQIGYCNGRNSTLNGLEYHKGSEINIAVTDLVLLLGKVQDIENNTFHSNNVRAFFIPEGTAIEIYETTLHFAPCKVQESGFKCIVVLPKGTNEPLEVAPAEREKSTDEDHLLFMKNKWLIAHPDRKQLIEKGAYPGIIGDNIEVLF